MQSQCKCHREYSDPVEKRAKSITLTEQGQLLLYKPLKTVLCYSCDGIFSSVDSQGPYKVAQKLKGPLTYERMGKNS